MSKDWVKDIHDMHTKFKVRDHVVNFDEEKLRTFLKFRLDFLKEELVEGYNAAGLPVSQLLHGIKLAEESTSGDDLVDSMIDLCVVAIGTLDAFGIDPYIAWNRVLEANMQKEPGVKPSRPNPLGLPDLIKPEGWVSPTHTDNVGLLTKILK